MFLNAFISQKHINMHCSFTHTHTHRFLESYMSGDCKAMSCHVRAFSVSPHLTECVLSCQREVEDDVDSYQVSSLSLLLLLLPL